MQGTRYTRRDAEAAFKRLAAANGATIADPSWGIHDPRREGAWTLDHNSVYGGYVIHAYCADSPPEPGSGRKQAYTAVTCPMGHDRRTAREFCDVVSFAIRSRQS